MYSMAIKVIDEKPDPSVVKLAICKNCGVKLEYTPADTTKVCSSDYLGDPNPPEFHIECPKCREKVWVPKP